MYSALSTLNTTTWEHLEQAAPKQHKWLPTGCPLLRVCVHGVCVFTAVCVHLEWVKCRALIPSMGYHTWSHVTSHQIESSFLSAWANAHNIILMAVLTSIHVVDFRFTTSSTCNGSRLRLGPHTVSDQMHKHLHLLWAQQFFQVCLPPFKQACDQKVKKCLYISLLNWPMGRTNPVMSHAVILQDGGALASKAIFFKKVTLIMFMFFN